MVPGPRGNCSVYTFWGPYGNNTLITLKTSAIPEPHYQIELIAGLILIERWSAGSGSTVTFKLLSTSQSYTASDSNTSRNGDYCYSGNN